MGMVALQALLVLLVLAEVASALLIKPDDPALRWSGRAVHHADGSRTADSCCRAECGWLGLW